jgi:hypothetical protein
MAESSHYFWKLRMQIWYNVGLPRSWFDCLHTYRHQLLGADEFSGGSRGSSSQLFVMKLMVWHFVSYSHNYDSTHFSCHLQIVVTISLEFQICLLHSFVSPTVCLLLALPHLPCDIFCIEVAGATQVQFFFS